VMGEERDGPVTPKKKYTPEFKLRVVREALEVGIYKEVALRYQIDASMVYNGPTKLDTKTARFKLHLRAWDGFGSSTHQVSRQRLFWNCSKKRVAYRSCR